MFVALIEVSISKLIAIMTFTIYECLVIGAAWYNFRLRATQIIDLT